MSSGSGFGRSPPRGSSPMPSTSRAAAAVAGAEAADSHRQRRDRTRSRSPLLATPRDGDATSSNFSPRDVVDQDAAARRDATPREGASGVKTPKTPKQKTKKISHILIKHKNSRRPVDTDGKPVTRTKDEALALAIDIHENITREIITFADAAVSFSECASARHEGDIKSRFKSGRLQKSFEAAAVSLTPGTLSKVIETNSGYHIIQRAEAAAGSHRHSRDRTRSRPPRSANPSDGDATTSDSIATPRHSTPRDAVDRHAVARDAVAHHAVARDDEAPDAVARDDEAPDAVARHAVARDAVARDDEARDAVARHAVARDAVARHTVARDDEARDAVARLAVDRHAVARHAVARHPVARHPVARHAVALHDLDRDAVARNAWARNTLARNALGRNARDATARNALARNALDRNARDAAARNALARDAAAQVSVARGTTDRDATPTAGTSGEGTPQDAESNLMFSHILIKHEHSRRPIDKSKQLVTRTKPQAMDLAIEIHSKISQSLITFADAAVSFSDCPSARHGGIIKTDYITNKVQRSFEARAESLTPGQISNVVESKSGYHILYRRE